MTIGEAGGSGNEDRLGKGNGSDRRGCYLAPRPVSTTNSHSWWTDKRGPVTATCVGFGPRFQHSTGQAYKGGPNTGVFLQITCENPIELAVPGHRYSLLGVVKEAEARSDLEVLVGRGRRALRVHLGSDVTAGLEQIRAAVSEALQAANT